MTAIMPYIRHYLEWQLNLFPLIYKTKHPIIKWEEYQTRKSTKEELSQWFNHDRISIAIVCGSTSNNFVALDFDNAELYSGFCAYVKEAHGASIEELTPIVRTGRGGHHVYLHVIELPRLFHPTGEDRNHIPDIQSQGGYVVAPPSIHPDTGKAYEFINQVKDLWEISSLRDLAIEVPAAGVSQPLKTSEEGKPIPRGEHDNWLFRRARSYRGAGDTEDIIFAKLQVDIQRLTGIDPASPYTDKDLRRIAKSSSRYSVNPQQNAVAKEKIIKWVPL